MAKVVAKIDPVGKNILVPTSSCESTREEVLNHPAGSSCEKQSELPYMSLTAPVYQLTMPYGGMRLDHYVADHKLSPKQFLHIMVPVIEGVAMMDKKGFCHQDIKTLNLLVTPSKEGIIIDYSLMLPYEQIYSEANRRRWKFSYFPYPPEYKMFYFLSRKMPVPEEKLLTEVKKNWFSFGDGRGKAYFDLFGKRMIQKAIHSFYSYAVKQGVTGAKLEETFAPLAAKLDLYSVGMIFVDINRSLHFTGYGKRSTWMRNYMHLIRTMCHPDPRERGAPAEILEMAKALLD